MLVLAEIRPGVPEDGVLRRGGLLQRGWRRRGRAGDLNGGVGREAGRGRAEAAVAVTARVPAPAPAPAAGAPLQGVGAAADHVDVLVVVLVERFRAVGRRRQVLVRARPRAPAMDFNFHCESHRLRRVNYVPCKFDKFLVKSIWIAKQHTRHKLFQHKMFDRFQLVNFS